MTGSPADDFAAILRGEEPQPAGTEPNDPPQPRLPAPNHAQGTSGVPSPTAMDPRVFAERVREIAGRNTAVRGGWVTLDNYPQESS